MGKNVNRFPVLIPVRSGKDSVLFRFAPSFAEVSSGATIPLIRASRPLISHIVRRRCRTIGSRF
jgi:hypothetical protein